MTTAAPHADLPPDDPSHAPEPATRLAALYRELWHHAEGARLQWVAALSLLSGSQLMKLALPYMAAQAINTIQTRGSAGLAVAAAWIGAILALHVGSWALHGPARVLERNVAMRVRRSVADALFARVVQAPLAWHDRHHSGDIQHRVGQASGALGGFAQTQFIYLSNLIHAVGPLVALWLISAPIGVLALAGFIGVGTVVLRFDRALMRLAVEENQAERRYTARLLDYVGNISALAALRLQTATRGLLQSRLQAVFKPLGRIIVITEWKWCLVDLLSVTLSWSLVVVYAMQQLGGNGSGAAAGAAGGTLLLGGLFMVHQYAQQAAGVLGSIAAHYQGLAHTQANHASANLILRAPVAEPVPPARGAEAGWRTLSLQGLHFRHADGGTAGAAGSAPRGGLHDVSLTLARGERVALVGPSGSGKSTLLRVMAGLYPAQAGTLSVDGAPQPGPASAARWATLVPQEAEVFEATVRENLCFGEPVPEADLHRAIAASALDEVLPGLRQGLDTPLTERGFNLSGGQRQRLALARGLLAARGSSVLLLDEPTSALDPIIEQHVHERICGAFADAAIVASVHRLSLLAHFDRVVFMAAGRVVDTGTVEALRERQPVFDAMCRGALQAEGAAA